jgi:hypothetical protein
MVGEAEGNAMTSSGRIPGPARFAWALRMDAARTRGLDEVRDSVLERFRGRCPLHDFHILPQRDVDFRAYVFFEKETDLDKCRASGISGEIADFVSVELERVGRSRPDGLKVAFEFDTDENVAANFEGNYFLRLR